MEYCEKEQKQKNDLTKAGRHVSENLKMRFENMSGYAFDDVRIHYNSSKPAQVEAAAYTAGNEVYLGAGQERHLGHELGHVLQQKRGHIPLTIQYKGLMINHDPALEREADMLAEKAMEFRADTSTFGRNTKVSVPSSDAAVVQMGKWKWSAQSGKWHLESGDYASGPPKRAGQKDGEIYDEQLSLIVTGQSIRAPKQQEKFQFDTTYTGDDEQYRELMETLRDILLNGGELDAKQMQQMNTYFSNASFFGRYLKEMQGRLHEGDPLLQRWQELLEAFEAEAGSSVFTRDIDSGELSGQPVSGGTMSVVDRMQRGLGRIRNYKDLNRGGGAGSYVRFVAERKRPAEGGEASNALNVGSLASAGVTVLYDAKSVVRDNSAPAGLVFNKQDSAGRIFETDAPTPDELRRKGRMSEEILKRENPDNQIPYSKKIQVPAFSDEYIMENAIQGLAELTRQAGQGQSAKEEYNETILFAGAKISRIKAVLLHMPIDPTGGLPVKKVFSQKQKQRQQRKSDRASQLISDEQLAIQLQIRTIDAEVKKIRQNTNKNNQDDNVQKIIELEREKSRLIEQRNELARKRVPEVKDFVFMPARKVSTDVSIRSPYLFEKGMLPPVLQKWYDEKGYGGVPVKYLFEHVSPGNVKREALPVLADSIWARGYARWQEDICREKTSEALKAHDAKDVAQMSISSISLYTIPSSSTSSSMGRASRPKLLSKEHSSAVPPSSTEQKSGVQAQNFAMLDVNNCLIDALSMAARNRVPSRAEIMAVRTKLLSFGFQFGEMLFASERIVRLIMDTMQIRRPVLVHYSGIQDESLLKEYGGPPVEIYHRGLHFSANRP